MNVFWRVFALEWRVLRREPAFWGTLLFFSAFLILAALSSDRFISEQTRSMAGIETEESARLDKAQTTLETLQGSTEALSGNDVRDPVWMGETRGARAACCPGPLSTVAVGVRDITPQILRVSSQVDQSGAMLTESGMRGPSIMGDLEHWTRFFLWCFSRSC